MSDIATFVHQYGYALLAAVGFVEYAGVPLASTPVLVTAGALTAGLPFQPVPAVLSAAAGAFAADILWFGLARWKGGALVGAACRLSSNPSACVLRVAEQVRRVGPRLIVPSKFLPGVGNLMAPAAGFACLRAGTFLLLDALAVLLWAGAYVALGRLLSREVLAVVGLLERFRNLTLAVGGLLIAGAGIWRVARSRWHLREHHPS
ncbi:MAG TPA: VTT domain-containing protein [Gemmatimonadota bacterium]|nr:VTT domain-containing protein [Gemmatimonadota bacterium]